MESGTFDGGREGEGMCQPIAKYRESLLCSTQHRDPSYGWYLPETLSAASRDWVPQCSLTHACICCRERCQVFYSDAAFCQIVVDSLLLLFSLLSSYWRVVFVQMSVDCRRQIVKRALKYARQQQSAKKKLTDTLGSALHWVTVIIFALYVVMQKKLEC